MAYLFGTETEFALTAGSSDGEIRPGPQELAEAVIRAIAGKYPNLPAPPPHRHIMLANGAAVYPDVGGHPETATAECDDPHDLAAQELALRNMLAEAARSVAVDFGVPLNVLANNIDYAPQSHTFGHHINLLASRRLTAPQIESQLVPLLVAMTTLAGTGRVSSAGFELSQRAGFMCRVAGRTTTGRGLISAKDKSLAGARWQRIHLISIDTPCSPWVMLLVPAILAMAVELLERGSNVGTQFALRNPIRALRTVSRDLTLRAPLELTGGKVATALGILTAYRDAADTLEGGASPAWVGETLALWSDILSTLAREPLSETRLDWPVKLLMLTQVLERHGMTWDELVRWHAILAPLRQVLACRTSASVSDIASVGAAESALPRSVMGVLQPQMKANGLRWSDLPMAAAVIARVRETCLLFHAIDDRPGSHRWIAPQLGVAEAVPPEAIGRAMGEPPANTRARARGEAIRNAEPGSSAWWTYVKTPTRRLNLPDPLQPTADWMPSPQQTPKRAETGVQS